MATGIRNTDIRLVIERLRPHSAYHWRGNGEFGNDYDAIGEWHDPNSEPPTEAEILAEWQAYLEEVAQQEEGEQQRQAKLADLRETRSRSFDPADYNDENALIQTLAQQLAWLEQEVIDLRGGSDEL